MDRRSFLLRGGALLAAAATSPIASTLAAATKPASGKKAPPKKPAPPVLPFVPGSWTIAILPDTQKYTHHYPGLLLLQTRWIVQNRDKYNIAYVLQNGDMTDRDHKQEWERADRGFALLDSVVPYAIVPGNHDYGNGSPRKGRSTRINQYFSPKRFEKWPTFGGTMEPGHIENNYHLFEAGGRKWIIIGLEFGPRDTTLEWADKLLTRYSDRKAIVFTHAYLYSDSTRYNWAKKGAKQRNNPHKFNVPGGVNDGEEMWRKVLKKHANVFMVMNGHIPNDGLGFQVSRGEHGNLVNEMAVDYQRTPVGGGAWLRLIEFLPDGKNVQARSYSPFYEKYKTDEQNQFKMMIS